MQPPQNRSKKTRKLCKVLQCADISVSEQPTNTLFVSNSSVLVGVQLECLEQLFHQFDRNCTFTVFPNTKSYSFVQFSDVSCAINAVKHLNKTKPESFPLGNPPIILLYVDKVPQISPEILPNRVPNGLHLFTDFVQEGQEEELIKFVEEHFTESTKLKNRHVLHFGYKFNYDENNALEPTNPIPPILDALISRIMNELHQVEQSERPDQITVNVYEPGQGIPPHVDTHSAFDEHIYSLSLGSDVVMEFRDAASQARHCDVFLARRSLMVLTGEARFRFKHGIMNRRHDVNPQTNRIFARQRRISITFRTTRRKPCQCPFVEFCDWDRDGQMRVPDSENQGLHLEREYVEKVYDRIADHFDHTRHSNWTGVTAFLNSLPSHSLVLDVGCGNGKYLLRRDQLIKIGCDLSSNLVKIAQAKRCSVFRADALDLPMRDGSFDAVISIAVIHHFSTIERRQKAITEILRVLRPGGLACVTAWSFDQTSPNDQHTESVYTSKMRANKLQEGEEENARKEVENKVENNNNNNGSSTTKLRIHDGKHFAQQDLLVPWASTDALATNNDFRYYHLFVRGELANLVEQFSDRAELLSEQYDEGNWIVLMRRREEK